MVVRALELPLEEWRPVPGFPGYKVSDFGQVRGPRMNVSARNHPRGYLRVSLHRGRTIITRLVHQLVLEAFVGPRPSGMQCRHLNGCKTDNRAANLRWGTAKENAADNVRLQVNPRGEMVASAKLTAEQVVRMRSEWNGVSVGVGTLARRYGLNKKTVTRILRRERWKHV